jgi:ATP-dependent RNA helicase HelY
MDDLGFGITLFSPWVSLDKVASLATVKAYTLRSSFRPSYNMAVNLVRNYDHATANHLLNSSFAQFVTDRNVVQWEKELETKQREADDLRDGVACERGDVMEYYRLRSDATKASQDARGSQEVREAITKLSPGDVVWPDRLGRAVVVEQARIASGGAPRITVLTVDRKLRRLGPRDFKQPPAAIAKLTLRGQSWRSPKSRKGIVRDLETVKAERPPASGRADVRRIVDAYESHPVHGCPDVEEHMTVASKLADAEDEVSRLKRQVRRRKGTIARTFDRVLAVLETMGYVDSWTLTERGELLTRIYNEADLLVVEALSRGWLEGLDAAELAAVASVFVFEARRRDEAEPPPTPTLARHERRIHDLYRTLHRSESEHEVELLKEPDAGFMAQLYEWASGRSLEDVLELRETSAGDFVRSAKQVIDLLQQLRQVVDRGDLATTLGAAVDSVQRGVVAYSSVV